MSDTDSFIDEVTEELKRDRMSAMWRRFGPFVIGALVAIVVFAAVKSWWDARQEAEARQLGAAFIAAAELEDPRARAEAVLGLAEGEAAVAARLNAAADLAEAGDAPAAAALLDRVAADAEADPIYRDLAALKALQLRWAGLSPTESLERLEPLAREGAPFRLIAREMKVAALVGAGELEAARAEIDGILADPLVTNEMRERVEQFQLALGGAGES